MSCLLFMMAATAFAHEKGDTTTYTFSFKAGSDMFYVPYSENETELDRLEQFIEKYKNPIIDGRLPLMVDGYCKSAPDDARNLRIAAIRSNRVKSELIMRRNLREDCFITRNHADGGDYVTVRVILPVETVANDEHLQPSQATEETPQQEQPDGEKAADTTESHMQSQENTPATTHTDSSSGHSEEVTTSSTKNSRNHGLSIRANLLRWATLPPDAGIEWHIGRHLSIMANGSWTSWNWNNADRRYALWEVAPEVRVHLGSKHRGYVGAMYKVGQFNYKLSDTGKQGDMMGGGVTGGYLLKLNNALSIDFNLAIGCLHADYDRYVTIDGVRVARGSDTKNWWGPISAGVTLVWRVL